MTKRSNETALPSAQRRMPQSVQNGHRDATGNGSETRSPESSSHGVSNERKPDVLTDAD